MNFFSVFATGVACQQGTLTLQDTWFRPPLWDLLVLQLLRPNSSNLLCLYSTFNLEYPLVLSRFCITFHCRTTPIGIISLIAKTVASTKSIEEDFKRLGMFFLTVMIGLNILMFVIHPIVFFIVRRSNPFKFIASIIQPSLVVFATCSA